MMTLYNHPISPYARRVRVLAAELGLPLKLIDLDFAKGEQRSPDYLAKNPNGRVPVLEHDGRHLWESAAILYELAGEHPQAGLVPGGLAERADMLRWMFWGATHFEPPGRGITFELLVKPRLLKQPTDPARVEEYTRELARQIEILNDHLKGRAWILGAGFSIADIAIGAVVYTAQRLKFQLEPYPEVIRWLDALKARPSWNA